MSPPYQKAHFMADSFEFVADGVLLCCEPARRASAVPSPHAGSPDVKYYVSAQNQIRESLYPNLRDVFTLKSDIRTHPNVVNVV
eukprot:946126-Pleurochrysis_carterae.AAC.2